MCFNWTDLDASPFIVAQKNQFMTQNGFTMYMLSGENDVFNPDHARVYQEMTRPLAHYFISSSHNTYLTKDQVTGASSTEPYIRYLLCSSKKTNLELSLVQKGKPTDIVCHWQGSASGLSLCGAGLLGWR